VLPHRNLKRAFQGTNITVRCPFANASYLTCQKMTNSYEKGEIKKNYPVLSDFCFKKHKSLWPVICHRSLSHTNWYRDVSCHHCMHTLTSYKFMIYIILFYYTVCDHSFIWLHGNKILRKLAFQVIKFISTIH
jgi:hypothetical protein